MKGFVSGLGDDLLVRLGFGGPNVAVLAGGANTRPAWPVQTGALTGLLAGRAT